MTDPGFDIVQDLDVLSRLGQADDFDFGPPAPGEYVPPPVGAPEDNGAEPAEDTPPRVWLERASDLLAEPDPGETPMLVEELLVDGAVGCIVGKPKTNKTWAELELAVSIVTGRPAFGRFTIGAPGPVILVLEESGRAALHRRLDKLTRGNAIHPEELRELHFSANRRVRLDDLEWQKDLKRAVADLAPAAVFLDPLARLKSPGRKENVQEEMSVLLDFLGELRNFSGEYHTSPAAIVFVHHMGHEGDHMRGSSDLESIWESKLTLKRTGDEYQFYAEHREAEASGTHRFRGDWDSETRSVRLRLLEDERQEETRDRVANYLDEHPDASANEVHKALGGKRQEVLAAVAHVRGEEVVPGVLVPPGTTPAGSLAGGTQPGGSPRRGAPVGTTEEQVVPDDLGTASLDELRDHYADAAEDEQA